MSDPYGQPEPGYASPWQRPSPWERPAGGQPPPQAPAPLPPPPPGPPPQQPTWPQTHGWQPQPPTPGWQQPGPPQPGWQQPAGWPPPPPPRQQRTGLTVALIAGGLVLALCLVTGLGAVTYRVLVNQEQTGEATGGDPVPVGDPFAATPAALFADGEAGIRLPEAEAAGDFSAEQVAGALDQVRQALVAARIDPTMLLDRDPRPFLRLMSVATHDFLRGDFESGNFGYFASQLADGAELAVTAPRVDGTVTYQATVDSGGVRVIEIATSFVWVYAFQVPAGAGVDGIVVVRDQLVWHLPHTDDVSVAATGLWLWEGEAYAWGIDCDAFDRSLLAPQAEPLAGFEGASDEPQMFDPESSINLPSTC